MIIGKLIPAGSGVAGSLAARFDPSAVEAANISAMEDEIAAAVAVLEEASEDDLKELMETGLLPENGGVGAGELEGFSEWTGEDNGGSGESEE